MKRVFLALPAGDDPGIREHNGSIRASLAEETIKWVRPENLHLTLHFFGDMEEEALARADGLFRQHLRDLPAFDLVFRDAGVFPTEHRPRVLWFGVAANAALDRLAEAVGDVLLEGDLPLPDKPFSPHLTIGRIKWIGDRRGLGPRRQKYKGEEIARLPVGEVHLIESILRPEGPEYRTLYKYRLGEEA